MVLWHPRLRVHIAAQMAALAISPTHRSFLPLWTQEILSKAGQQGLFPQPVKRHREPTQRRSATPCGEDFFVQAIDIDPALIDQNVGTSIRRLKLALSVPRVSRQ